MWTLAKQFMSTVVPAVIKPMRVLWNEIIGFVFIVFAVMIIGSTIRRWNEFDGTLSMVLLFAASVFFFFVMAGYGLYSFFRARKINRT